MRIVKDVLRAMFNRAGKKDEDKQHSPAGKHQSINEFIDTMKESFAPDDHVLMTRFFHDTVLRKARDGEMEERHKNAILSMLSANMLGKLTDGENSYYYPGTPRRESNGSPIVFAYDCYVPVHMLIDHARSIYNWMRFLDGNRNRAFGIKPGSRHERREENERMGAVKAYMDSLNDIRDDIKKPDELDARTDLNYFDKDRDAMPFFASALEMGAAFDFVMRPHGGKMPARKPRHRNTPKSTASTLPKP